MKIIAHRGYSANYPEATPEAYRKALELPIHGVECDIRLCRSGEAVLIHDPVLDRISDGQGRVSEHTLAQLRTLNFGTADAPQQVLTLGEFLDLLDAYPGKHAYIETKHPLRYGTMLEEELVKELTYRGLLDDPRIHVISFALISMVRMRHLAPQVDRILLRRDWQRRTRQMDPKLGQPTGRGLSIEHARQQPELVGKGGLPTYMWTVNDPEDLCWAAAHGVDIVATDDPAAALAVTG